MNESEMENRVAKSNRGTFHYIEYSLFSQSLYKLFVKVQRVYGSFCIGYNNIQVRYTLMVQEIGYPIKILSKFFSTKIGKKLHPMFVTGLIDGEGCFSIKIAKTVIGWRVQLDFTVGMHIRDKELLQQIYKFFNVGTLRETNNVIYYSVRSIKDLDVVVSHFTEFPLQTQKGADFILFAKAFHMIKNKSHLTTSGIEDIVSLKASMRCARGINNTLMCYFPNTVPVERSIIFSGALARHPE